MSIQFLVNTIYSFLILGLISSSFFLVFKPSKYFHLSHAAVIVLSAYTFLYLNALVGFGMWISVCIALLAASLFGVANELLFYRRLANNRDTGIKILVLSLGVYLVVQNVISIVFGDQIHLVDPCGGCLRSIVHGPHFVLSKAQAFAAGIAGVVLIGLMLVWYLTSFGRSARSVSENRELAGIIGVDVDRTVLQSVALGSLCAGIAGLLIGFEVGVTPTAGFSYLLFGVIAMVVGGTESLIGTIAGALVLTVLQSATAYFIDTKWASTVSYALLIGFLLIRPQGVRSLSLAAEQR
jgi:branched-chain amino acid transport system permease protein